jgi:hypothetical protein
MVNSAEFQAETRGKAQGLQIFNTTTRCVETWNGAKWIQQCPPQGPFVPHYNPTCDEDPECTALDNFTAVTALNDFMQPVSVVTQSKTVSFTMKPVVGGVFYMGFQCTDPNKPN